MNGYNFTERVRKVLAMARDEAQRLHHEYVGTEHILLGLICEGEGVAAMVLQNLNVDLDELKFGIESVVKRGRLNETVGPDLPYTSRGKKVLELAMSEARAFAHTYVGTEHILLGLLREGAGIGAKVLVDRGVTLENARTEMLRILGTEVPSAHKGELAARPATSNSMFAVVPPHTAERVRDVMRDAEDVATEFRATELMPAHVAIALLRNGDGLANAILDRFTVDRRGLIGALTKLASEVEPAAELQPRLGFDQFMVGFARQVESESRWQHAPPTTLNILIALLDTVKEVATIFAAQGIDTARVREEARRIRG